jgi:small redox-active disulfide protein 2
MDIKIIGSGCADCDKLYTNMEEAIRLTGVTATLGRVEDLVEMVKLGVMTTPSVTINGKLVVSARVPKVEKLVEILKENM